MAVSSRWTQYADLALLTSLETGVARELILAVCSVESNFRPAAIRQEPRIGDASRGLMQLLYRTAKEVGFTGAADGLFDPATNMHYGALYLAKLLKARNADMPATISQYNGGYRPGLALGARAAQPGSICLAWSQTGGGRKCLRRHHYAVGEFGNQPHVDEVLAAWRYFTDTFAGG